MNTMNILDYMQEHLLYLDGGMGTLLQEAGLAPGEYPERWNLVHPEIIQKIQKSYFEAGSHVVATNTFGANALKFTHEELAEIIAAAVQNAKIARDKAAAPQPKYIALDIGPCGKLLKPYGDLAFEDAVSLFAEVVRLGAANGVDLIYIETMSDSYETKAALLAAKENCKLPVFVSNAYGEDGKLMTGASPAAMVAMAEGMGADAIGANCSLEPKQMQGVVAELLANASIPVLLKPNAGLPQETDGKAVYGTLPDEFAADMAAYIRQGVHIVGGCCGTTPAYIQKIVALSRALTPVPLTDKGITCVETFDYDVVDKIYEPYDNLGLSVILHGDGTREYKVLGSLAEAIKAQSSDKVQWNRLKEIFRSPSLQMVSFTITEKGYALQKADGTWFPFVEADIKNGPDQASGAMAVLVAMLFERYRAGKYPLALVSMDNCSKNGAKLRESVLTMAEEWKKEGFVDAGFIQYISDEKVVAFPWTMIDKITPRPSEQIAADLEALGVEDMQPVITGKKTYIAPFVNAEKPQYLVIEDSFPNGRPALEKGFGVYLADRNTVNLSERMKVTVCLNPVHSATGPLGVVLGYDLFAHMLNTNEDMMKMARMVAYDEGLPVVADPGILSPQAFVDELFNDRFPNEYLGDTNLRLAVDVSQMVGIRFGETIKAYVAKYGDASKLTAIPLGIAGWLRYMLAVDDEGKKFELAPDPMNEELTKQLGDIVVGKPETFNDQLKPILSNERIFFTDLYKDGVGKKIEDMFCEMISGPGAVRATVHKYVR